MDSSELQNELIDLVKRKHWSGVDEAWLELMENPPEDLSFYEHVAGTIFRNGGKKRLPDLWELVTGYFLEQKKYEFVLSLVRIILEYIPEAQNLHPAVLESFRQVNKDCPRLEFYIRSSHLKDKFHLKDCLEKCEEYLNFDEGEVFEHVSWGVGKVVELDIPQERVTIEFPGRQYKTLTFEGAYQYLNKLSHDHFLAIQENNPERLKELAENDPIELVKTVLRSYDTTINQANLKNILCKRVIPEKKFSSWWSKLKAGIRNDPWIELDTGNKPELKLREKAKDYFDEMYERFEKAHPFAQRRKILNELVQHQKGKPLPMEKAIRFISRVRWWHSKCKPENLSGRLSMLYLMEETGMLMPSPAAPLEEKEEDLLNQVEDPVEFLLNLGIFDYQCRALETLLAQKPDEMSALLESVYLEGPIRISQYAFEKLLENKDYETAQSAMKKLLGHFDRNPAAYAWTLRQILKKRWRQLEISYTDFSLLVDALHYLEKTRQRYDVNSSGAKSNRNLQSQLRSLFTGDKFLILHSVIQEITLKDARHLYNSLLTSPAFIPSVKDAFDNLFRKTCKDAFQEEEDTKPKVHYCTAELLKEKQDQLRRIKTIEIPRNTKEIEKARAHGDLSENAEYDAAKDRQAMLFKQMETLQDLIARARIINPENIQTEQISIGTRFTVLNCNTNQTETYNLLGLWELDPENHIISYSSPFGQEFLGKKIEEIVEVNHPGGGLGKYKILSIENALLPKPG